MKIAAKFSMTALATVMGICLAQYALAESAPSGAGSVVSGGTVVAGGSAPLPSVQANAAPAPAVASPTSSAGDSASVKEVLDSIKVPGSTSASGSSSSKDKSKSKSAAKIDEEAGEDDNLEIPHEGPKVPGSVKGVVKKLNSATDDVTLEDLNSAREAIVKLDVLIDIEKRLNDLVDIRMEREEKVDQLSGALPSSAFGGGGGQQQQPALAPPPLIPVMPSVPAAAPPPPPMPVASIEVVRVSGASGSYTAHIKEGEATKQIRPGDKLSDGSNVTSISRNGVTITTTDDKTKTIQVKDVGAVFSAR